jgi:hypothetical protein
MVVDVAHILGALLVAAGLPAQLRHRPVLSRLLLVCGVVVAHIPDLLASLSVI